MHGREEECIEGSGGKAKKTKPPGQSVCRWEHNIKMELRE
jgi:hypothetical protein